MSWWESAYRSGHVNWDPGEYDGHLPWVLERSGLRAQLQQVDDPKRGGAWKRPRAIDLGCGNGKSVVWLARQGFHATGIDSAPTAIEQARAIADRNAVGSLTHLIAGSFPADAQRLIVPDGYQLVTERAFLQHIGRDGALDSSLRTIANLLAPDGFFYSLSLTSDSASHFWGIGQWNERGIREKMEPHFEIVELEKVVFTPGERGSMSAWRTLMRPRPRRLSE